MAKRCLESGGKGEQFMPGKNAIRSNWYVIQVRSTTERAICRQVEQVCAEHDEAAEDDASRVGLRECFSPRFKTQRKWKGQWQDVEHLLFSGYVIADARNPEQLAIAISRISGLCRLLSSEEAYVPLNEGERAWVERQTHKGDRVIPMSFAHKVGDDLEVMEGPLKGYTGRILKVDRQNSLAHLEFHLGQMTIKTKVGLAVVPE